MPIIEIEETIINTSAIESVGKIENQSGDLFIEVRTTSGMRYRNPVKSKEEYLEEKGKIQELMS